MNKIIIFVVAICMIAANVISCTPQDKEEGTSGVDTTAAVTETTDTVTETVGIDAETETAE